MNRNEFADIARTLAHELRNPLNAMRLNLELLTEDLRALNAEEESLEIAASLSLEVDQLAAIIQTFRDFSRHVEPKRETIDLGQLCAELASLLKPQLAEAGTRLTLNVGAGEVIGDRTLLRQALLNLLLNALTATRERGAEGRIVLSFQQTAGEIVVTITDNGSGPGPNPERHFELFRSTKPKEDGGGIGLPLARKIARLHGGEVTLEGGRQGGAIARLTISTNLPKHAEDIPRP